jgi:tetratricopeptide (TPR) repeat protein
MTVCTVSRFSNREPRRGRALRSAAVVWLAALVGSAGCGGDLESRMTEVRALQDVGQFNASIEELREILTISPDLPEANYRLGLAFVQTGEPSRAVWPLQKAAESSDYGITAGVLLASTHFQTKNYDEAVRAADRVLESDPDRQAAMRIRANANISARRLDAALLDTVRLVERHPDDYGIRTLHATVLADLGRVEEAKIEHDLLKEMGGNSDDPTMRARSCLAPAVFAKDILHDDVAALALYEDCASLDPTDPMVLNHMMGFYDGIGEGERATKLIRNASLAAPENLALRQSLAGRLQSLGETEEAEQVLVDAVESFGSAAAWNVLASFYRVAGQPQKALAAIEKVGEIAGSESDAIRFTHADILIDLGELERAEVLAGELEQSTYAQLIRGRIQLARGNPEAALESFEKGIRAWPNNAGARFLAGIAARDLGDYDRAVSELREAVRAANAETDAALELARILYRQGQYQQCISFANMALRGPKGLNQSEAYVVAARALTASGQPDRARRTVAVLRERGHEAIAARELAILERATDGPQASLRALEGTGLDFADPANRDALIQLVENLALLERIDEALARIDAALARDAESAGLYEMRGVALLRAERPDEARISFDAALELDEESAMAMAGLATIAAMGGERARAVELFDRAYALDRSEGGNAYAAAQIVLDGGDAAEAERRLREVVKHHPDATGARNDLAWMLAEKGEDLDLALALVEDARRRNSSPEILDTLGSVHFKRGEYDLAVEALEAAVAARPDSASVRYRLALALDKAGQSERAREMLRSALAAGAFPEADDARRELARLDRN